MSYYPIFLDILRKRCIVVGGGVVAMRKVNMLLDHGAQVIVISPELSNELSALATCGSIEVIGRDYQFGDLQGAFVVVAATDDSKINEQIAHEAMEMGILINVVDVPELSNFIVPSYLRRGDLTIAVSTNGKSPALARKIRSELEENFGEEYATLVSVINDVRTELKQRGTGTSSEVWQRALQLDVLLDLLREGRLDEVRRQLLHILLEAR